jgi:hypothetical protein
MSGLLWSALGGAIANTGAAVGNALQQQARDEERYSERLALEREKIEARREQQARDLEFRRELAAQRQSNAGAGGGGAPLDDATLAAMAGMTVPELQRSREFTAKGPDALAYKSSVLDDEYGKQDITVPADRYTERVAREKAQALAEIQAAHSAGKNSKEIAEARRTMFEMGVNQDILAGRRSAGDVATAQAAMKGEGIYKPSGDMVTNTVTGDTRTYFKPEKPAGAEKPPAPPAGYRWTTTADGGQAMEPIPGSPDDRKRTDQANAATASANRMMATFDQLDSAVEKLAQHPGLPRIVGISGVLPNIPGGKAADAAALLDHLRNKVALDVLSEMRQLSQNGSSGLGQLTDREGKRLENSLAALSESQSIEQLQQQLAGIRQYIVEAKGRIAEAAALKTGNAPAASTPAPAPAPGAIPSINSPADLTRLPAGATFRAPDGSIRIKR